ncbi:uncharacterized protein LOC143878766 [Tasmannia lanceolata]|uniref:uncharacterized protein LOC143878766 n=1 Tax=Tasmannia lanceolata TaxID=3420 RepID=UPI004064C568
MRKNVNPVRKQKNAAAFFDVDGTITSTNVVAAYFFSRVREIPVAIRLLWVSWFSLSCVFYLIIDRIDRTTFNRLFYSSSFKDRSTIDKKDIASIIYEDYYRARTFGGALKLIEVLKKEGFHIVLVTGSLDFLIAPLARDLGADFVYASELVEAGGKFTGEVKGAGSSKSKKAQCVLNYARAHEVCLSSSLAFGDSIADLSMLETVRFLLYLKTFLPRELIFPPLFSHLPAL